MVDRKQKLRKGPGPGVTFKNIPFPYWDSFPLAWTLLLKFPQPPRTVPAVGTKHSWACRGHFIFKPQHSISSETKIWNQVVSHNLREILCVWPILSLVSSPLRKKSIVFFFYLCLFEGWSQAFWKVQEGCRKAFLSNHEEHSHLGPYSFTLRLSCR
jgi:hypothetical protein